MKKQITKSIIKSIYLVLVFMAALFGVSKVMNMGNTDMTSEMGEAVLPVISVYIDGYRVNCLHGYKSSMEMNYLRDTLLPIEMNRKVDLDISTYGTAMESLAFEVRSIGGERLVESTQVTDWEQSGDEIRCELTLKDLIDTGEEYMLVLMLTAEDGEEVRYYTRIVQTEEMYIREKLEYISDFHNRTFNKEAAAELTKYLESNSEGDNSTYHKVNIHSSFAQVTWGDLQVEEVTEPIIDIKELADQTGSFSLEYMAATREGAKKTFYQVREFYRVRYTPDRMYLLDFDREMTQIFEEETEVFANDKIMLGIVDQKVEFAESDGGNTFAFVAANKLYSYNVMDHKLARLFSFYEEGDRLTDLRSSYNRHRIRILNVDETGNVEFLVYGYMNRGRHEGEVGVCIYAYNSVANTVEEQIYIPYSRSYELLKSDMERLTYINKSDICYFILADTIYAVDLADQSYEVVVSGLTEDTYKVSESNKMLVWQEGEDREHCRTLKLFNLSTEVIEEIDAGTREYISLLGFMEEDMIYGLIRDRDIKSDQSGNTIYPMYCLKIQGDDGSLLKTYREPDNYVIDSKISENQIILSRVTWNEEEDVYQPAADDQIMSTEKAAVGSNSVGSVVTEQYETIVQIAMKEKVENKEVTRLTPKEVLFEGNRNLILEENVKIQDRFYVYGKNGVEGIFTHPGEAVTYAYGAAGVVVNDKGNYIWRRTSRSIRNQIMAIEEAQVTEQTSSLSVCLDTILTLEGVPKHTEYLLDRGETVRSILEANLENVQILDLSGCSLDAILYYVNMDIPVLAALQDGNAVLIIGFNELNIVLMDPVMGTIYKKGMNDSTQWLLENGNRFITYVRDRQE